MMDENAIEPFELPERLQNKYMSFAPIYATLARNVARDFVRLKGMSVEAANIAAVELMLGQARDTIIGMEGSDTAQLDSGGQVVFYPNKPE